MERKSNRPLMKKRKVSQGGERGRIKMRRSLKRNLEKKEVIIEEEVKSVSQEAEK